MLFKSTGCHADQVSSCGVNEARVRPGCVYTQLQCSRGWCVTWLCAHTRTHTHLHTETPAADAHAACAETLPSSSSCRLSAAASCRVFSLQEPSFICTFRKGLGFRGLGHCGTSAEPGTLTQGGDPVFPWESNQKLQGGCCKPNHQPIGGPDPNHQEPTQGCHERCVCVCLLLKDLL